MIIDRNCSCMNSGDRCYERLLFIHETCWSSNISWSLGGTSFKHLSSRFWSDFSPLLLWLLMQHLQYPILGSSEEIESEFESKWLDDFGFFIHCHNFSDWSLAVLTYSVLVVSQGSSLSFAILELNSLPYSSPLEWKVLAEVIWTTGVIIKETKSICKNMVNIATSHQPLTSELMRLLPLKQKSTYM